LARTTAASAHCGGHCLFSDNALRRDVMALRLDGYQTAQPGGVGSLSPARTDGGRVKAAKA